MDQDVSRPCPSLLCADGTNLEQHVCDVSLVSVLHASAKPHVQVPCTEDASQGHWWQCLDVVVSPRMSPHRPNHFQ
eukprot:1326723-Rhodomonas_salina.2